MFPATAICPPDFFKPRRRPALSRPLREDPPAFLCAIELFSQISLIFYTDSVKESSHFFLLLLALGRRFLAGRGLGRGLFRLGRFGCLGLDVTLRLWLGLALGPFRGCLRGLGAAGQNLGDADHRKLMAETALAARILAPALLEGDDLVAAGVLKHLAGNASARHGRGADLRGVATEQQDFAEFDNLARFGLDAVDPDDIFSRDAVLLAAGFNDCEHRFFLSVRFRPRTIPGQLRSVGFLLVF